MTDRQVTLSLNLKSGGTSALKSALVDITREMQRQQQEVIKRNALLADPLLVAARVRSANDLAVAQLNLTEALRKEEAIQGVVAERGRTADERRIAALKSINEGMEGLLQKQSRYDELLKDPRKLAAHVSKKLEIERQEKQLNFAESKERAKQLGPGKALADLFNIPDVSKMLGTMGGKLAGVGEGLAAKAPAMGGMLGKAAAGAAGGMLGEAGGALAGAAAGPIGLAIAAAIALTPAVKALAGAPFAAVASGMAIVNKALSGLTGPLGAVGSMLGAVEGAGSALKGVGDKLGPLGIGMSVVGGAIEGVTKQVTAFLTVATQLVAKAQPGVTRRLQFAIDDTAAVVGHRLVPVIELITKAVRGIGDVLQTILPSAAEFRSALSPLSEAFDEIKEAIAPVARLLKVALTVGLRELAFGLRIVFETIKPLIQLARFALPGLPGGQLESSTGAAARPVSFMDTQTYARSVYAAAAGSGIDPSRQTAENTTTMIGLLRRIADNPRESAAGAAVAVAGPAAVAIDAARRYLWGH
jgi:hypothetical protein